MAQAVIILGSNSGDRYNIIKEAITMLSQKAGKIAMASSLYETEPWGFECDEFFINRVIVLNTPLAPHKLLQAGLEIEKQLGRERHAEGPRYSQRPIDIDILFYDSLVIDTPVFTVPHPRITERRFVLIPLCEIMPDYIHPVFGQSIEALLRNCTDNMQVTRVS